MSLSLAAVIVMGGYVVAVIAAALLMLLRPGGASVVLPSATATSSAPGRREEIPLGGEAESFGIARGRVLAVLLRSDVPRVQELALATGLGLVEDGHVPADAILSADGKVVQLAETWTDPSLDGGGPPPIALRQSMTVLSVDRKRLGKLRLVCYDRDSGAVTDLVVARGRSGDSAKLLAYSRVKTAGPNGIATEVRSGEWSGLPTFATDDALRQAILDRIAADPALQPFQRALIVDVEDQRVRLRGYVTDRATANLAALVAHSVPGVLQLDSAIVADQDLAQAVREALTRDPALAAASLLVRSRFGVVEVAGEVPDTAALRKIGEVAGRVPGVLSVRNGTLVT